MTAPKSLGMAGVSTSPRAGWVQSYTATATHYILWPHFFESAAFLDRWKQWQKRLRYVTEENRPSHLDYELWARIEKSWKRYRRLDRAEVATIKKEELDVYVSRLRMGSLWHLPPQGWVAIKPRNAQMRSYYTEPLDVRYWARVYERWGMDGIVLDLLELYGRRLTHERTRELHERRVAHAATLIWEQIQLYRITSSGADLDLLNPDE